MTKVAICFSGLPRLTHSMPIIKWQNYIKKYNADVFVHTWITDEDIRIDVKDQIISLFDPKVIKLEPLREFSLETYNQRLLPSVIPYHVFSSFTSIYESMKLVNDYSLLNEFEYDFVVRARFDVMVNDLNLESVNGVAVPDDKNKHKLKFKYKDLDLFGINDLVAYGNQQYMTLYSNTIDYIHFLYHEEKVDMCPELFLTANLIRQNVPIIFRPLQTEIIRR